jgi:hypothetical protein
MTIVKSSEDDNDVASPWTLKSWSSKLILERNTTCCVRIPSSVFNKDDTTKKGGDQIHLIGNMAH